MRLGPATLDDVEQLAAIGRSTFTAHFGGLWSAEGLRAHLADEFDSARIAAELKGGQVRYWLARMDDQAVGFAKLKLGSASPSGHGAGLELQKLYFERGFTGQGFGMLVIEQAMTFAMAQAQPLLWLDVFKCNMRARQLYERCGFTVVGDAPFATDRQMIGQWAMECPLRANSAFSKDAVAAIEAHRPGKCASSGAPQDPGLLDENIRRSFRPEQPSLLNRLDAAAVRQRAIEPLRPDKGK